jgi:L-malate glycosyltransferase
MTAKIAFIIDHLSIGGTEKQLIELINRLDRKKFEPFLFLLRDVRNSLSDKASCEVYLLNIRHIRNIECIRGLTKFISILRNKKMQIVQTFFPDSTFIGVLGAKIASVPIIISSRRDMGSWHRWLDREKYRLSSRWADRTLVNSEAVRNYLYYKEKRDVHHIDVIHNGIDPRYYEVVPNRKTNPARAITIGVISNFNRWVKRFDIFIRAMTMVANKYQNVDFLVAGNIEMEHWDERIPENLKTRFTLLGEVKDVRHYLQKMDIGILCSDSEGFSNVILEYMASSIPCVCTNTGGNIETIVDGVDGFLFPPGDAEGLFQKVCLLIDNPLLGKKFSEAALKKVKQQFDWCEIANKYKNYYLRLISEAGLKDD